MSPKSVSFTRETVVAAGLRCLQAKGPAGLTARAVAAELGTSVGPIYRAGGSMDSLESAVLEQALGRLWECTRHPYSPMPFRNLGVGMVVFAREEPRLYETLFVHRRSHPAVAEAVRREVEEVIAADPALRTLPEENRTTLLQDLWVYSHGLAMSIIAGHIAETDDAALNERVGRVGYTLITAAFGGDSRWAFPPADAPAEPPPEDEEDDRRHDGARESYP